MAHWTGAFNRTWPWTMSIKKLQTFLWEIPEKETFKLDGVKKLEVKLIKFQLSETRKYMLFLSDETVFRLMCNSLQHNVGEILKV